jgi:hypothetical protein
MNPEGVPTRTAVLFEAFRPFTLSGDAIVPGQVIDLRDYEPLPPGRAEALVKARYGRLVTIPDDPADLDDDVATMTNAELRAALADLGLPVYGAKADLTARLRAARTPAGSAG